jgi:hypothetical protein
VIPLSDFHSFNIILKQFENIKDNLFSLTAAQRYRTQSGPAPASIRPFGSGSSDEDPYSVAGSGSSGSSGGNNIIHHTPGRAQIPPPSKSAVQVRKVSLFCSKHNFFICVRNDQGFC